MEIIRQEMNLPTPLLGLVLSYLATRDLVNLYHRIGFYPFLLTSIEAEMVKRPYKIMARMANNYRVITLRGAEESYNIQQYYGWYGLGKNNQIQRYYSHNLDFLNQERIVSLPRCDVAKIIYCSSFEFHNKAILLYLTHSHELRLFTTSFQESRDKLLVSEVQCACVYQDNKIFALTEHNIIKFDLKTATVTATYPNPLISRCVEIGYVPLKLKSCVALLNEEGILSVYHLPDMQLECNIPNVKAFVVRNCDLGYLVRNKLTILSISGNGSQVIPPFVPFLNTNLCLEIGRHQVRGCTLDQRMALSLGQNYVYLEFYDSESEK